MEIEAKTIEAIWQALQRPAPVTSRRSNTMDKRVAEEGWASDTELEDYLLSQDRRLDPPAVIDLKTLAAALNLPSRWVFPRPARRNDEVYGFQKLSAVDAAALCIWLERLGFSIDVSELCDRLRGRLATSPYVTGEEISILFYQENRHRLKPVTLTAPHREWNGQNTTRYKTPHGYRVEYVADTDGQALWLTVRAPKYRKRPEPKAVECPDCGMTYVQGSRTDEQSHRSFHRKRFSIIEPRPHRRFIQARERDLNAGWVSAASPKWKRQEMYDRALEFKRELGYDFPQWALDAGHDPDAVGFLFSDDDGRIIGACSFRPQSHPGERPWRLDWIWLCPSARRKGHLDRQWDRFRQRFGVFDVEPPISKAMQAFLRKRGCADLIR